jgi:hypothetical protein
VLNFTEQNLLKVSISHLTAEVSIVDVKLPALWMSQHSAKVSRCSLVGSFSRNLQSNTVAVVVVVVVVAVVVVVVRVAVEVSVSMDSLAAL